MQTQDGFIIPSVAQTLHGLSKAHPNIDREMILDVYLLVANNGKLSYLPDEDLIKDIESTDPAYWDLKTDLSRRQEYLTRLAESKYMKALVALQDAMKAVNIFIDHMERAIAAKASISKREPIDSTSGGTVNEYASGDYLDEINKINEEFDPSLAFDNLLQEGQGYMDVVENEEISAFLEGAAEDQDSGMAVGCGGKGLRASATVTPGNMLVGAVVNLGVTLPTQYPILFDWYTKLAEKLGTDRLEDKDSDHDTVKKRTDQIDELDRVSSADAIDLASDTFDKKFADKSLLVKYDREAEEGTSHVFVLLDTSGSMMAADVGGRICRAFVANVVTLALLNLAHKERYKVWVLPFDENVGTIMSADNKNDALTVMRWLGTVNYDGGGTDIQGAVLRAYQLLEKDKTYEKADIVLITDGCSPISDALTKLKPQRLKLRTMIIGDGNDYGEHSRRLKNASDSYAVIEWDNASNSFTVGDTLKGITPQST